MIQKTDKNTVFSTFTHLSFFLIIKVNTNNLEKDDITLEQSFQEYQKGMLLVKKCNEIIDKVEKKVLVLNEDGGTDEF